MPHDPVDAFRRWFAEAQGDARVAAPEAGCLSTLGPGRTPEGRMVLLKGFDSKGFVFFTNLESNKGRALRAHPRAGLTFYWLPLGRQVRLAGGVEPLEGAQADAYFQSRPRGSRIGAWASRQSRPLKSRADLKARVARFEAEFAGKDVARPKEWSGFRVVPDRVEFWQEGKHRLHDRIAYSKAPDQKWRVERLFP